MPLEIRELLIKAVISDEKEEQPISGEGTTNNSDMNALIDQCVEKVLAIIKDEKER